MYTVQAMRVIDLLTGGYHVSVDFLICLGMKKVFFLQ